MEEGWSLDRTQRFVSALGAALTKPLPGLPAQMHMAPEHRRGAQAPLPSLRQSAVLILLYSTEQGLTLPFTLRPATLSHHAGEICFPGGGREADDASLRETALREAEEEIGLPSQEVNVLGQITPLQIAPSRNLVHPYVGWMPTPPRLRPNASEVAEVVEVSLERLLTPSSVGIHTWFHQGEARSAPCYRVNGHCIWGATAMILSEFLTIVREIAVEEA